ncbi:hypothetical protein KY363_03350 [Candidatus Woesearchaeota archaeon]|nr:hypothetical protein [Candidatus Woesearchaeota archaeon]
MIECYSLYAVLEGDDRRVVRIAYNIAEVWRGKRFGRAYAQKPTQEEMDRPGFDPMSMLRQEVISHNYERLDPLADVKLDATAAAYLRAAHKAAGGARVTYHFSDGENSRSEDVNEETLVQKEEAGRFARFRAEGCITESIPEHILKYESAGSRN